MQVVTILLLILNIAWSRLLYLEPTHDTIWNYLYNLGYGLNFIIAAIICIKYFIKFVNFRPTLFFFGVGFSLFSLAQFIWMYYNIIAHLPVPYPGLSDLFWILFYPCMWLAFILLIKNLGSNKSLFLVVLFFFCSLHFSHSTIRKPAYHSLPNS
jgi:hypothetical protein